MAITVNVYCVCVYYIGTLLKLCYHDIQVLSLCLQRHSEKGFEGFIRTPL